MPTTINKYNAPVSMFRCLCTPSYVLTLAGGAANSALTLANSTSGSPFGFTTLATYEPSVGQSAENIFLSDLTLIVRRAALFSNFADGLLWNVATGPIKVMLQLTRNSNPNIAAAMDGASAMPLLFPALNAWFEVQERITPYVGTGIASLAHYKLICGRPAAQCPEVPLETIGISSDWNGKTAYFYLMVEIEHTFALT